MAKQSALFLPVAANNQSVKLTSADTTVAVTCFTAGSEGSDVKAILVVSDDTAAINLKLYVTRGGTDYLIATVNIPLASGTNGSALGIDLLALTAIPGLPVDSMGKPYLPLKSGDTLKVGCLATMTAAKTCTASVFGQDY